MFHGSIVALVTPMKADGQIDYPCLRKLVDWHVACGTNGIVVVGTTGEAPTLELAEQLQVIRVVTEEAAGRIAVIAGTGSNCTKKTIDLTRQAMEIGVDACLLVTPYYNKPTQEGLYQHYRAVAEAVPIPQLLYNVPGRTGCDLLPETVARLAPIPNIVGIKDGMPERAQAIHALVGEKLDILSGDDATALAVVANGGRGVISVAANVVPKALRTLCAAALAGDQTAVQIEQRLAPLFKQLFVESNPIPVKWAMNKLELIPEGIRLPLTTLAKPYHATVSTALEQAITLERELS